MAGIIRNPKDGIDELIEKSRHIDIMLKSLGESDNIDQARIHLENASEELSRARDHVRRIYERKQPVM